MIVSARRLIHSLLYLQVALVASSCGLIQAQTTSTGVTTSARATVDASYARVPLSFEVNDGQADSEVKFLSRGDGYSLFLTSNEAVFELRTTAGAKAAPSVLRMELVGADREAKVSGVEKLPGVSNYYMGRDPSKWRSGVSTYGKVKYTNIYPGVDAVFYGNQRQLEYDFVVAPGVDAGQISLALTGVKPSLDADGNVMMKLPDGDVALRKPLVYQSVGGGRKVIDAGYSIAGNKVTFRLGKYDHTQALVIDPVFTYLTYLGGSNADQIGARQVVGQAVSPTQGLALDSAGNVYVTGYTLSTDFPLANAIQTTVHSTNWTAFVSALNPAGTALLYSTYLGGSAYNGGASIATDSSGDAYVVGTTTSVDFPVTAGAYQTTNPSGSSNAFVAKFNPAGALTKATFLGGSAQTSGFGVATDAQGLAYVVGYTSYNCTSNPAACFPTTPGALIPAPTTSANGTGYLSVFDANLSSLTYSTILGDPNGAGGTFAEAYGVTVDATGNFYAVGITGSPNLPTTPGAFQPTLGVPNTQPLAGFVAKFGPVSTGAKLTYLTYLEATGVSFGDLPGGVVADAQGNAYVGGYTNSPTFPVTLGAYQSTCSGNSCAFVTKLNPTGTGLVWSTLVEVADYFGTLQLDTQGNVYVVGHNNGGFAAVNPIQPGQSSGGFIAKLDATGSTLLFSTLVGGTDGGGSLNLTGVAVDASGNIYVAGNLNDGTLPTTPGVVQPTFAGGSGAQGDGIIGKIGFASSRTGLVVSPGTASTGQTITFTATVSGALAATPTGTVTFYNGPTVLGSATLNNSGVGTFSTTSLAAGTYQVIARYGSDGNYGISASAAQSLTISGPQVAVPNVVGLTQAAATTSIQGAGLVLGTVSTATSSTVASGNVISESPAAGTSVNAGSAVNLVVSSGPVTTPPTAVIQVSSSNPQYAAVATPGGTAGPITLRGTISATGGGNIGNAVVAVTLVPVVGSTKINCSVTNTAGALAATCATVPVNAYDVQWTIVGGGFSGPKVDSSLSVYDPALGSISGSCVAINNGVPFNLTMSAGYPNGRLKASLSFTENSSTGNFVLVGTTPLAFSLVPGPGAGQETGILTTLATLNGAPNYTVQATLVENAAGQAIQCGLQVRDPNGVPVTTLSFAPAPAQLSIGVPGVTGSYYTTVTLSAHVFTPSPITGSIQFQVNGKNVGTPVPVSGSGTYTTRYAIVPTGAAGLGVDNTITAILTPTSGTVATASNVLTIPDALVGHIFWIFAYGTPGQTISLSVGFIPYLGFVQYQINGVNVGAPVQVTSGAGRLSAPLSYTIPRNASGSYVITAILLSTNGVPLQSTTGLLYVVTSPGGGGGGGG